MTPKQYQKRAIGIVRSFGPDSDVGSTYGDCNQPCSHEFVFTSGLRVSLHFAHKFTHIRGSSSDWIHFALFKLGEELGRKIASPRWGENWWKWNISYSGSVNDVRTQLLAELERRLERCAEHGACKRLALMNCQK